ncbi:XerC Integrase [Candidatus Methylopumilus universalis]|uniref:tyrosine-type recombinase/integrase n=1 Tax=Candidatus Methylopumilus universalis TaxID=2588536 RepID=UPI003BEEB6FC
MAKQNLLTDRLIKEAACPLSKNFVYLNDGSGLRVRIRPNGTKTWIHRWKINGVEYTNSLGSYPQVSLKDARVKLTSDKVLTSEGKNPSLERKISRKTNTALIKVTFEVCAYDWLADNKLDWSATHYERTKAILDTYISDEFRNIPITYITDQLVLNCLVKLQKQGKKATSRKAKSIINNVFLHAMSKKQASSNPVLLLTGNKLLKGYKPNHFKAIQRKDVGELMHKLSLTKTDQPLGFVTTTALFLTLYTGLRNNSIRGAKWKEINLQKQLWTIPSDRMKSGNTFAVPLPLQAIKILIKLKNVTYRDKESFVFQSERSPSKTISENTVNLAVKTLGFDATQHGMRTLIQTTLLHFGSAPDAVDRQLDHAVSNKNSRGSYMGQEDFMEARIKAMQNFANWCDKEKIKFEKENAKKKNTA